MPLRLEHAVPAHVDELRGQVEVGALAGLPVELDQRGLDHRVPVGVLAPVVAEVADHAVGGAPGDVEQVVAAGGAVVRDAGLDEVADAVQLVAHHQVVPAHVEAGLHVRVEVAVRLAARARSTSVRLGDRALELAATAPGRGPRQIASSTLCTSESLNHMPAVRAWRVVAAEPAQVVDRAVAFQPAQRVRRGHVAVARAASRRRSRR